MIQLYYTRIIITWWSKVNSEGKVRDTDSTHPTWSIRWVPFPYQTNFFARKPVSLMNTEYSRPHLACYSLHLLLNSFLLWKTRFSVKSATPDYLYLFFKNYKCLLMIVIIQCVIRPLKSTRHISRQNKSVLKFEAPIIFLGYATLKRRNHALFWMICLIHGVKFAGARCVYCSPVLKCLKR